MKNVQITYLLGVGWPDSLRFEILVEEDDEGVDIWLIAPSYTDGIIFSDFRLIPKVNKIA